MENRIHSNISRGRSVLNDTTIQSLFCRLTEMHTQVIARMQKLEAERGMTALKIDTQVIKLTPRYSGFRRSHMVSFGSTVISSHWSYEIEISIILRVCVCLTRYIFLTAMRIWCAQKPVRRYTSSLAGKHHSLEIMQWWVSLCNT